MSCHIAISDPTLRDGNHAIGHQLTPEDVAAYAGAAEIARIPYVEVGHGNGLGASSLQVGLSAATDAELLAAARSNLTRSKLAVHSIPGFATIHRDLEPALAAGVDVFRIGAHCTEADITKRHIQYLRDRGKEVFGALMMVHMPPTQRLVEECRKMESYGAQAVILMDSVGGLLPHEVRERVGAITSGAAIPVGFHAHNNLGMAIANSVAAVEAGATILDGTARGFGAGAGNAQVEVLVAVLHKLGYETGIDLHAVLDAAELAEREFVKLVPTIKSMSIVSGLAGVFSGFATHVQRVSALYGVDARDLFFELGRRKVVAGQEDAIIEAAIALAERPSRRAAKEPSSTPAGDRPAPSLQR